VAPRFKDAARLMVSVPRVVKVCYPTRFSQLAVSFPMNQSLAKAIVFLARRVLSVAAAAVSLAVAKHQHLNLMQGPSLVLVAVEPEGRPRMVA
jgi:hypothetical protein